MDVNYRFWVAWVGAQRPAGAVLDFGCGDGIVVRALREAGVDCHGTDVFYGGMQYDEGVRALVDDDIVRAYEPGQPLPFADDTFELIISNMVLEHVADLEFTAREFDRVLKPGGLMRHHFPSRAVLREGHIGIPLAHWLPPGRLRTSYILGMRTVGVGTDRDAPPREWTRRSLEWIDRYCFYRPYLEVERAFAAFDIQAREADYCRFRAQAPLLRRTLARGERLQTIGLRAFAFMALEMRRRTAS